MPPEIDPSNTWIVSDTHFGHGNIVDYCGRPLDHEQLMIAEWRKEVPDDATVLHLGDLVCRSNALFKHVLAKELTGARKLLIQGNHDKQRFSFYRDAGFRLVRDFSMAWTHPDHSGGARVSFGHYPLKSPTLDGCRFLPHRHVHIHGHIHNNGYGGKDTPFTPFSVGQINVSVEQTHYRPINLQRLLEGHFLGCYAPDSTTEAKG